MPIYSYHCEHCQTEFTELRRCSEMDAPIDCPECGNRKSQLKLSGFAVGSGASSTTTLGKPSKSPFRWATWWLDWSVRNQFRQVSGWMEHVTLKSICELAYSPLLITPESLSRFRVQVDKSFGLISTLRQYGHTRHAKYCIYQIFVKSLSLEKATPQLSSKLLHSVDKFDSITE